MSKIAFLLTLLVTALVCLSPAAPAQAAAARTFVSAAGSDSNNCTNVATPCRHLATAYAATAANGEIYVLDPANYGAVTITGPVSIEGHGWASIAPTSGNPAITINANPGDKINIIGVVLDGGALTGTNGIQFNSGGSLNVQDSVIRNFGVHGINFVPTGSTAAQLSVTSTLLADNGAYGIFVQPPGTAAVGVAVNHVEASNNGSDGFIFYAGSNPALTNATVFDSSATGNAFAGYTADTDGSHGPVMLTLYRSVAANNLVSGVQSFGAGATIRAANSVVTGNPLGWNLNGGVFATYGDNYIDGNGGNVGSSIPVSKQ
jgi:hypothetical protein